MFDLTFYNDKEQKDKENKANQDSKNVFICKPANEDPQPKNAKRGSPTATFSDKNSVSASPEQQSIDPDPSMQVSLEGSVKACRLEPPVNTVQATAVATVDHQSAQSVEGSMDSGSVADGASVEGDQEDKVMDGQDEEDAAQARIQELVEQHGDGQDGEADSPDQRKLYGAESGRMLKPDTSCGKLTMD